MLAAICEIALLAAFLIPASASLVLLVQISAFALMRRTQPVMLADKRPAILVLVPAHNEEDGIAALVHHLQQQLSASDRLLVVADNCSDRTARLAAQAGAEVLVRTNMLRLGKGYALAAGLASLSGHPPQVVVFVDADCRFSDFGVEVLSRACMTANAPVQCLNLMLTAPNCVKRARIAEFAWRIRNELRPAGLARLHGPCQLLGTGMAMPWPLVEKLSFATGHVTEDLMIGLQSAMQGSPPRFVEQVTVTSYLPQEQAGCNAQKQRWMHGHLALIASHFLPVLWQGVRRADLKLLALAADLLVPPLGLLAGVILLTLAVGVGFAAATGAVAPLLVASVGVCLFASGLVIAWALRGRGLIGWSQLLELPSHFVRVLRIGARFALGKRSQWVRADRSS